MSLVCEPVSALTMTGVALFACEPFPSSPMRLNPQHHTPAVERAQACEPPRPTAVTLLPEMSTCVGVSTGLVIEPIPTWPYAFWPQHHNVPSAFLTAHVKYPPAAAVRPPRTPAPATTGVGDPPGGDVMIRPSPSSAASSAPQQRSWPSLESMQLCV